MKLEEWLEGQDLGQKDGSALLGVSQSTLSRVLNGQDPTGEFVRNAYRITEGKVTPNDLFHDLFAESAS